VACFGDHTNDVNVTEKDVIESYKNPYFLAYFACLVCYLVLLAYWINFSHNPTLRRYAWGSCGGSITGMQNFLKDSLTLYNVSHGPVIWALPLFIVMAAVSAFSGLILLTACMKRYDATYSAASFVGSFVVSASIMSAAHYQTFQSLHSLTNYILYPIGLLVLMIGVYILVRESRDPDEGDDDDDNDDGNDEIIPIRKDSEDSQIPFMYTKVEDDVELLEENREV